MNSTRSFFFFSTSQSSWSGNCYYNRLHVFIANATTEFMYVNRCLFRIVHINVVCPFELRYRFQYIMFHCLFYIVCEFWYYWLKIVHEIILICHDDYNSHYWPLTHPTWYISKTNQRLLNLRQYVVNHLRGSPLSIKRPAPRDRSFWSVCWEGNDRTIIEVQVNYIV